MRAMASEWTQDDVLMNATETFTLLPRPSGAATAAFSTLLTEYWPGASRGTQMRVDALVRGSRHASTRVIETLDTVQAAAVSTMTAVPAHVGAPQQAASTPVAPASSRRARVTVTDHRVVEIEDLAQCMLSDMAEPSFETTVHDLVGADTARERIRVSPPAMVEETAETARLNVTVRVERPARMAKATEAPVKAAKIETVGSDVEFTASGASHAREVMRRIALTGDRGPAMPPRSVAERLSVAPDHRAMLADLLHLPREDASVVLSNRSGVMIAMRTLGVSPERATRLAARWHGGDPASLMPAYRALGLTECLEAVADWREIAGRTQADNDGTAERAARSA